MTDFGDIRSICNTQKQDVSALVAALASYNDKVPASEVISYIRDIWGWCPASSWKGGQKYRGEDLLDVHEHDHPTLIAYVQVDDQEIEVLRLDNPEDHVQAAIVPIRKEALDIYWMPWAQAYAGEETRLATWLLYACLDDPTLRGAARMALKEVTKDVTGGDEWDAQGRRWKSAHWAALSALEVSAYEAAKNASLAATVSIMWSLVLHNFSERVAQKLLKGL